MPIDIFPCCTCIDRGGSAKSSIDYDDIGRDSCNVSSKYSPEYVRGRALNKPEDALKMVVSEEQ